MTQHDGTCPRQGWMKKARHWRRAKRINERDSLPCRRGGRYTSPLHRSSSGKAAERHGRRRQRDPEHVVDEAEVRRYALRVSGRPYLFCVPPHASLARALTQKYYDLWNRTQES